MRMIRTGVVVMSALAIVWPAPASNAEPAAFVQGPRSPACTITGTNGRDEIRGTPGDDVICTLKGADYVNGRGGDDVILLGPGSDGFNGGGGNDIVYGGAGRDWGDTGPGDDEFYGQGGGEYIVSAGHGTDVLNGGAGDDSCLATWDNAGGDTVIGGPGHDIWGGDPGDTAQSVEEGPYHCEGG